LGSDAGLTALLFKEIIFEKCKEVKTGSHVVEFSFEGYGSKTDVLPMMTMS
jgi:hypothetical protein